MSGRRVLSSRGYGGFASGAARGDAVYILAGSPKTAPLVSRLHWKFSARSILGKPFQFTGLACNYRKPNSHVANVEYGG